MLQQACSNKFATSLLQVCYKLRVFACVHMTQALLLLVTPVYYRSMDEELYQNNMKFPGGSSFQIPG